MHLWWGDDTPFKKAKKKIDLRFFYPLQFSVMSLEKSCGFPVSNTFFIFFLSFLSDHFGLSFWQIVSLRLFVDVTSVKQLRDTHIGTPMNKLSHILILSLWECFMPHKLYLFLTFFFFPCKFDFLNILFKFFDSYKMGVWYNA